MNFRVGMKVVCVRDGVSLFTGHPSRLVSGQVYTITKVWRDLFFDHPVCLIAEVQPYGGYAFDATRFRPAVSPQSEISFTQGAPLDSEQWDNRRRLPARVGASA